MLLPLLIDYLRELNIDIGWLLPLLWYFQFLCIIYYEDGTLAYLSAVSSSSNGGGGGGGRGSMKKLQ